MEHRIKQTDLHLQMFFFLFYYKYTKLDRQIYESDLIYKNECWRWGGGWAGMLCWFYFCDEDGHDEDLTGDVWLAD